MTHTPLSCSHSPLRLPAFTLRTSWFLTAYFFRLRPKKNRLVLETLEPLAGDRKCFRMINGVLVERTVKDVVPALHTNAEGLKKVLDDLVKQYKTKQDELEKWKVSRHCPSPHIPQWPPSWDDRDLA